jgi:hypothetical protein
VLYGRLAATDATNIRPQFLRAGRGKPLLQVLTPNLLTRYDDEMRRNTVVAGYDREQTPSVSRFTTRTQSRRLIIWHRVDREDVARVADEEWLLVQDNAKELMWKLYAHDSAHDELRAALLARSFSEKDHSTLMVTSVDSLIERIVDTQPMQRTIAAKRLTTPESLDAYLDIWNDVWPDEPNASYVDDYRVLLRENDPGIVFFAGVSENEEPVSTGYMFHQPGSAFGLLCGGTTKTNWRKKHAYTATLVARAHAARERGATFLAVEASPESEPILRRLGFAAISTLAFYERSVT